MKQMKKLALFVRLHAKQGKAAELQELLTGAIELANKEAGTITWYALQFNANTFGVFDAFADETGREAHLHGDIAAALMAHADDLLAQAPNIEKVTLLAAK